MQINETKPCEMIITNIRHLSPLPPSRKNGKALNRFESVKILGLILSSDLEWERETNLNISKCSRLSYALEYFKYTHYSDDSTYLFEQLCPYAIILLPSLV